MPARTGQAGDDERLAPTCPACGAALPDSASIHGGDRLLGSPGLFDVRVCASCGAGRTGPPLSEVALAELYRQGYASHQEGAPRLLASVMRALKRLQVSAILRRPPFSAAISGSPGRALDVGCGRGDLAAALLARGWRAAGIEPSERAAAIAARRGVQVVGATLATAQLPVDGYDLVVLRHSLEHLPEPLEDLRRVREALRPGGRIVISAPNFASWQRKRFAANWFHLDLPRHRVHFTPRSLAAALRRADLAVDAQFTSTSVLGLPASLQYVIVRRCLAPGGLRLRLLAALCCAAFPATWLIDRLGGERDTLHVIARRG